MEKAGQRTNVATYTFPFSETIEKDSDLFGANVLGRWNRSMGSHSNMSTQIYYDRTDRKDPTFEEVRDTLDFDFQHSFPMTWRHELTYGLGYRLSFRRYGLGPNSRFRPSASHR